MELVKARVFKNGNSKGFNYTKADEAHFKVTPNDVVVKKYSDDGKTLTLVKMTKSEYEDAKVNEFLNAYKLEHNDVFKALAEL